MAAQTIGKKQDGHSNIREEGGEKHQKWVINISDTPLTEMQEKLLAHGPNLPNYAVVPKHPPTIEVITLIEKTCQNMVKGEAEELRGEVKAILRKIQPPKSNISLEEQKAIDELRKDDTKVILTVDKGVSLVVMNKEEYIKKAEELLLTDTYRTISNDPTNKYKTKLIKLLKTIKAEGGISEAVYKRLYPMGTGVPKFYGLPKVHKQGIPLRPIVSSIGAASYETAKELARILKPLMGNSPYQVQNSRDFIQQIQDIKLKEDQCIMSYDVKALFTSVPIQPAIDVIKKRLEEDEELQKRTSMSVQHIISLLEFCLRSTYFTFQDRLYEQQEGAAMGSPISPIVANLFMGDFEKKSHRVITTPSHVSGGYLWMIHLLSSTQLIKKVSWNT